ncbi:18142_t:CDS:2 [Cetraspora pellucida]|uniref:18142_t:CDS:1 n=1 Tax=Cetraspora pellucida TaxID=1433469 RepID=A0ACA9LRT1_9GLOM|nr:18142_t:CDS:2 [Cetraspora pellucida]
MSTEAIIPETGSEQDSSIPAESIVDGKDLTTPVQEEISTSTVDKIKQDDILETPPSPGTLQHPPPPYSQWDQLSLEQLLEKSKEVLTMTNGGEQKDGKMLDKMTQLESLISSLQAILNDQTFAMHGLRSQLSELTDLKKMQDKQETITNEEVMKQVVTMKALTENLLASNELKQKFDASVAAAMAVATNVTENTQNSEEAISISQPPTETDDIVTSLPSSEILNLPPTTIQPSSSSRQTSRVPSRVPSRVSSRVPSRTTSRAPSRAPSSSRPVSRTVSPAQTPISLSRSSSKYKIDHPTTEYSLDIPKIDEGSDEELENNDPSFNKMCDLLNSLINEATEAVEKPVKGREKKKRAPSTTSQGSFDFGGINDMLDELEEEDDEGRNLKRSKSHQRQKSKHEERFEQGMLEFNRSIADFSTLVDAITTENDNMPEYDPCLQYVDPTDDLIRNPSEGLANLDDFSQQCRLLTRALILPFLHATHSFMSESLKTSSPRSMTSTTRTFMNLMYWTFLFTLGSLVLDAWLCEVAGRQVIRMVDLLKPEPFGGFLSNNYEQASSDQQDGGFGVLNDGKKKNVKFRTGPKMKSVTWKGVETGVVGSGKRWLKDGMKKLKRKGRRLLTSGRWEIFSRTTVGQFEDESSDDNEEWEIVDFDSSDGEDSETEEDEIEDPALVLRRRITNERSRRAGHVNSMIIEGSAKKEIINDLIETNVSSITDRLNDMQETDPLFEQIINNTLLQESDENSEDVNLNIPGSFPSKFKWTPPPSPIVDVTEVTENVRRVISVVLRRPKRNGPFGGSGSFWIMKTRKIKTRNITSKDVTSAVLKSSSSKSSPILKKKSSKSLPIPKRTWIRRNSI